MIAHKWTNLGTDEQKCVRCGAWAKDALEGEVYCPSLCDEYIEGHQKGFIAGLTEASYQAIKRAGEEDRALGLILRLFAYELDELRRQHQVMRRQEYAAILDISNNTP